MKIILFTDLHIGAEGEDTFGVDVRQNFLDIKAAVKEAEPDYIIIAGDLSLHQANAETYAWIRSEMDELAIPYDVIVGNHDESTILATTFEQGQSLHEGRYFYKKQLANWTAFYLDTGVKNINQAQLDWLATELAATKGSVLIFMHHPPLEIGVPFMDINHALDNKEAIQAILFEDARPIPVFSGHYHVEKTVVKRNITVQITPSCYFQIAQKEEFFEVDHRRIAYREIVLGEEAWKSTVYYFEGNTLKN